MPNDKEVSKARPRGKAFKKGKDKRRHKLTRSDCSKGGKRTFQLLVNRVGVFADDNVYNFVSVAILRFYRDQPPW